MAAQLLKFYMEHGSRGWQPIAVPVEADGKPVRDEDGFIDVLHVFHTQFHSLHWHIVIHLSSGIGKGWIRITERQARAIDQNLNYSSMERLTGCFFGRYLPGFIDQMYRDGWEQYLDKGMDPNQFKILATEVQMGDEILIHYYVEHNGYHRLHEARGTVINKGSRIITFNVATKWSSNIPSKMYGEREYIIVYEPVTEGVQA